MHLVFLAIRFIHDRQCLPDLFAPMRLHKVLQVLACTRCVEVSLVAECDECHFLSLEVRRSRALEEKCMHVRVQLSFDASCIPCTTRKDQGTGFDQILRRRLLRENFGYRECGSFLGQNLADQIHHVLRVSARGSVNDVERSHGCIIAQTRPTRSPIVKKWLNYAIIYR